jgi:hypothetical protein
MNVLQIIEKYLRENGYDGLCNVDYECGCSVDDLAPCCEYMNECEVAYKVKLNKKDRNYYGVDYIFSPKKELDEDEY